ncbi:S8 family serine peptidase [Rubricoccus marinus]|uniref:S8 family serine peptidase n=1 Tax=Rubricoccus marinus TaxID=716817 RepID=UPI0015C5EB4C|nr:S8 family serine peptidase [Rubricoccus marinus]
MHSALQALGAHAGITVVDTFSTIPAAVVTLDFPESIEAIRALPFIDYVEPAFDPEGAEAAKSASKSSCGSSSSGGSPQMDMATTSYGDVLYARLPDLGVTSAWNVADGAGVEVAVLGTGVSSRAPQVNGEFVGGQSTSPSRQISRTWTGSWSTTPEWHDDCGHETKIIGTIAAPRDGTSMSGIAYNASIYAIKTDNDVILGSVFGGNLGRVIDGIELAAPRSPIVNMAFGTRSRYQSVTDAIEVAYDTYDTLFVGAAGTGICEGDGGPLFPARMPEVVAVAQLLDDGSVKCWAPQVFAIPVDRAFSLDPDVYSNQFEASSGSSFATGVFSGMAALLLGKGYSRSQTIYRLRASTFALIGSYDDVPDIAHALGLVSRASLSGPSLVTRTGGYTYSVTQENAPGTASLAYAWAPNGAASAITTVQFTRQPGPDRQVNVTAAVTQNDPSFGEAELPSATATKAVTVRGLGTTISGPSCVAPGATARYTATRQSGTAPWSVAIQTNTPCEGDFKETCNSWEGLPAPTLPGTEVYYKDISPSQSFAVRSRATDPDISATSVVINVSVSPNCQF